MFCCMLLCNVKEKLKISLLLLLILLLLLLLLLLSSSTSSFALSIEKPFVVLCKLTQIRSPCFPLVPIFQHSQGLGYLSPSTLSCLGTPDGQSLPHYFLNWILVNFQVALLDALRLAIWSLSMLFSVFSFVIEFNHYSKGVLPLS